MASRRERKKRRRKGRSLDKQSTSPEPIVSPEEKKPTVKKIKNKNPFIQFYWDNYKPLILIPFIILLASFAILGITIAQTGDFINKDVSLKGGFTITVLTEQNIGVNQLENELRQEFSQGDVRVRALNDLGRQIGIIIDASDVEQEEMKQSLSEKIDNFEELHSIESIGPSLGKSFFEQTAKSVWIAFIFMGMVVFLYFGTSGKMKFLTSSLSFIASIFVWYSSSIINMILAIALTFTLIYLYFKYSIPSFAVVLAALSDIIGTLAIMNLLGIRLSTAGIAALLMLIGYSVDTDILLNTRVLKSKEGSLMERMLGAVKTGLTMNITTMAAIVVALLVSQSETISQIMTILLIGLILDMINTWFQNTGILRYYLERKKSE